MSTPRRAPFVPGSKGRWFTTPHTGLPGSRAFHVYVPKGLRRNAWAPLLVALHGCTQTAQEFAQSTRFHQLADRHKFVLVFPEQARTSNAQRCWNWHLAGNQLPNQGETAILAGIVRRVINDRRRWRIDPTRVYAVGLSAGGAMASTLGINYPELFAGIGVHSGPPYRAASSPAQVMSAMQGLRRPPSPSVLKSHPMPPMIIFQGTSDGTVWPANAQRHTDQWLAYWHRDAERPDPRGPRVAQHEAVTPETKGSRRGYLRQRWTVDGRPVLEVWRIAGLSHAWSGGGPAVAFSDRRGPRASTEMWRFLSAQSLPGRRGI